MLPCKVLDIVHSKVAGCRSRSTIYHSKNQIFVLANNLVTVVRDYPSHANSKNVANLLLISWQI